MKKSIIHFILLIFVLLCFTVACHSSFTQDDFYNNRRRRSFSSNLNQSKNNDTDKTENPKIKISDDDEIQKLFDNAEVNKDALFPASNFDNWVFYMTNLSSKNVGSYCFSNKGSWKINIAESCEEYSDEKNVGSGIKTLTNVKYFRYKNRSDRWKHFSYTEFDPFTEKMDPNGKFKKREERFLFFRFTATAAMNTQLDNAMICVDTYTKFCWYYSEPSRCKVIAGNKVPNDWVDFEDPKLSTESNAEHTEVYDKFYYYDPVGYVKESGEVILYDWAKQDLEDGFFNPRQNYANNAEPQNNKPGKSPYYIADKEKDKPKPLPVPSQLSNEKGLSIQLSYIQNKNFASLIQWSKKKLNFAYLATQATTDILNESIIFPNPKNKLEAKAVPVGEIFTLNGNNHFSLTLDDKKDFKIKTAFMFANEQIIKTQGLLYGNDICDKESGVLLFTFYPSTKTQKAYLVFNGIEKSIYKKQRYTTEITCSLEKGAKMSLDKAFNVTVYYNLNGEVGNVVFEKQNVSNAQLSLVYTFSFLE